MAHEIKVMLNPLRTLKDGRKSLVLRLTVNRKRNYYSLGFKAFADEFNEKEMKFYKKWNPLEFKEANVRISSEYKKALNIITSIEKEGEALTIDLFSKNYLKNNCKTNVIDFFEQIIDAETKKDKIGNANVYKQVKNAIKRFVGSRNLEFSDVTVSFLNRFELFLHKSCTGNGISNYMRTFRALLNKAIAEGHLKKTNTHLRISTILMVIIFLSWKQKQLSVH